VLREFRSIDTACLKRLFEGMLPAWSELLKMAEAELDPRRPGYAVEVLTLQRCRESRGSNAPSYQ